MNPHISPTPAHQTARVRPAELQRLVRKHEQLEEMINTARSHGLPTAALWCAMVCLEDRMRLVFPRAYAHWITIWAVRRPRGLHPVGGSSPDCGYCASPRTPALMRPGLAVTR